MHSALLLLPDFALILLGTGLRRALRLDETFWNGLEKLVYFVLFPALLFHAITRQGPHPLAALPLALGSGAILGAGALLGLTAAPLFRLPAIQFASLFQCAFRFNSYIALAIAGQLDGVDGIATMGMLCGLAVPLANLGAVWMLARHGNQGLWRSLLQNPLILATCAGLLWNSLGLEVAVPVRTLLSRLADAAIALGLLSVGAALRLGGHPLKGRGLHAAAYLMAIKLLFLPALVWLALPWCNLAPVSRHALLVFAALPVASSAYILTQRMGGDGAAVAWTLSLSTLLAMVTLPFWLSFLIQTS